MSVVQKCRLIKTDKDARCLASYNSSIMLSKIWQLVFGSFKIWSDARASQMAAAMTYYSMLSLAPTLIISIAIASYIFDDRLAEQEILAAIEKFTTPDIAETIAGLIRRANLPKSGFWAGSFSIGIFIFGASGVFSQLYDTFNYIWHVDGKKQGFWFSLQKRGIGILMVLFVGLLLIGALVLNSVEAYVAQLVEGQAFLLSWLKLADRGLSFLLLPVVFSLMFWFVPATKIRLSDVIPAGVLTAMLVLGSRYIIQLYLQFSSTSEVYGAAGSLVVMLIWIYITCLAVFFGAAFSHAWSNTFGSRASENITAVTPEEVYAETLQAESDQIKPDENQPALVPERRTSATNDLT